MLKPEDLTHDFCGFCGGEIHPNDEWEMTTDREGRMYCIHGRREICRRYMDLD